MARHSGTELAESDSIFVCRPQGLVSAGESCRLHGTTVVFKVDSRRSRACLTTDASRICGNVVLIHQGALDNAAVAFEAHRERNEIWRLAKVEPSPPGRNSGPAVVSMRYTSPLTLNVGDAPTERQLSSIFEDPEREPLRYDTSASNDVVSVNTVNSTLTIRPLNLGTAEVAVTAIDSGGLAATWRFTVVVARAAAAGLPVWALGQISEAAGTRASAAGGSPSAASSSTADGDMRRATVRTNVVRTLATATRRHGGCMAELDISLAETGLNCPGGWVAFSCDGTYARRAHATTMFRDAQLAFGLGRPVSVSVTDRRKHNGHCVADRIDVFKR